MKCPNKNTPYWRNLVSKYGEPGAYFIFYRTQKVGEKEAIAHYESLQFKMKEGAGMRIAEKAAKVPDKGDYRHAIKQAMEGLFGSNSIQILDESHDLASSVSDVDATDFAIDLMNGVIAIKSGANLETYARALATAVVVSQWESPEMKLIRGKTGSNSAHDYFQMTPEYLEGFQPYTAMFRNRGDYLERTQRAILADILTNHILVEAKKGVTKATPEGNAATKFKAWLQRIWMRFKRGINKELNTEAGRQKFMHDKLTEVLQQKARAVLAGNVRVTSPTDKIYYREKLTTEQKNIVNAAERALESLRTRSIEMSETRLGVLTEVENRHFSALREKYPATYEQIMSKLLEYHEQRESGEGLTSGELEQERELIELSNLYDKFLKQEKLNDELTDQLESLNAQIASMETQINDQQYGLAFLETIEYFQQQTDQYKKKLENYNPKADTPLSLSEIGEIEMFRQQASHVVVAFQEVTTAGNMDLFEAQFGPEQTEKLEEKLKNLLFDLDNIKAKMHGNISMIQAQILFEENVDPITKKAMFEDLFGEGKEFTLQNLYDYLNDGDYRSSIPSPLWQTVPLGETSNLVNSATLKRLLRIRRNVERNSAATLDVLVAEYRRMDADFKPSDDVKALMKKRLTSNPMDMLWDYDENNRRTHFLLSPFRLQDWKTAQRNHRAKVAQEVENLYFNYFGEEIQIPWGLDHRSIQMRKEIFAGKYLEDLPESDPHKIKMKEQLLYIENEYHTRIRNYERLNSEVRPDLEEIVQKRKKELTAPEFRRWKEQNFHSGTVRTEDGTEVPFERPTGEFVQPTNGKVIKYRGKKVKTADWRNPDYEILMSDPVFSRFHSILIERLARARRRLPMQYWNDYTYQYKAPQVTRDYTELMKATSVRRNLAKAKSAVGDITAPVSLTRISADDFEFMRKQEYELERKYSLRNFTPPERYESLLPDPEMQSTDLIYSMSLYEEMSQHFAESSLELSALEAIRLAQSKETITPNKYARATAALQKMASFRKKEDRRDSPKPTRVLHQFDEMTAQFLEQRGLETFEGEHVAKAHIAFRRLGR